MSMTRWLALSAGLALTGQAVGQHRPDAGMFRYPDISGDRIAFSYAGDIWTVGRDGGTAVKLTGPTGAEILPRFSPDGSEVAFLGNYEGNADIYVIPVEGGIARRVTYHPSPEMLNDWTDDGRLLFSMFGLAGLSRQSQLFTVSPSGGLPAQLPVPYGAVAAISPDGQWLAYTPHTTDNRTWKRYRGGMATDIWLFNLEDHTAKQITDFEGTDSVPMWHGGRLYYMSDDGPSHRLNIWVYDPQNGSRTQVTTFADYDVKAPAIGPGRNGEGEIIFQHGATLKVLRLDNRSIRTVDITIPGDFPDLRSHRVDASNFIEGWDISPTGKRAVVSARGDLWTLPAENGSPRNLTRTDGAFERNATWSPDGRWIAYASDESGEYELYIRQSDGKGRTVRLTDFGGSGDFTFIYEAFWSPDSKKIAFNDKTGTVYMVAVPEVPEDDKAGEIAIPQLVRVTQDAWANQPGISWSHDSRFMTYQLQRPEGMTSVVMIYDVENATEHQVTTGYFNDTAPTFDRKGKWLFYASNRQFQPMYGDLGTDWTYAGTDVLLAVPLTGDVEYPWLPKSDEEKWEVKKEEKRSDEAKPSDEKTDDAKGDESDDAKPGEDDNAEGDKKSADETPWVDDGLTGRWEGKAQGPNMPPDGLPFTLELILGEEGAVTGTMSSMMGSAEISGGSFDKDSGVLTFSMAFGGESVSWNVQISGNEMKGVATAGGESFNITASRTRQGPAGTGGEGAKSDDKAKEKVEITFEGFEARAFRLPVAAGRFGGLAVNDQNHLVYARFLNGTSDQNTGIMVFDLTSDDKAEKTVAAGAGAFAMSADGKKILVMRGNSATIQGSSAGASGKPVVTSGMTMNIDPREEWAQIVRDAWRRHRDFFYVENMHGVDWKGVLERYEHMLKFASSRADVSFIIGEMIAELNVGHAYYWGGDIEAPQSVSVGMLGVDFEVATDDAGNSAYRIARIIEGGPWDTDARNPLRRTGVKAKEGEFLLAVNGVKLSTGQSPWAGFQGLAGRATTLTLSTNAVLGDDDDHDVLVEPLGGEGDLRYRAWTEHNRKYVEEKTGGKVGYIYVPNTGVDGQNELVRGFYGQLDKAALIIDERWNGGGQIPQRFIELLNRPRTNYWARRDGNDWPWPPDSHQGPKTMLINGLAGSGGDMFPALFRQSGLGKLIGMRTWGGLVGISGVPGLIDGGYTAVPTFGYYETNGTWGIEGHGVDPDIVVVDDPSKMVNGGDPQLDAAIELMLREIEARGYRPPKRPADPDRSGMGLPDDDK
ncbi:MAG: PD40 domain-containing protein [Phycisphaerales bacterium]|nr:PD40 domain-containing protein [Phycisphaerales bacterium]